MKLLFTTFLLLQVLRFSRLNCQFEVMVTFERQNTKWSVLVALTTGILHKLASCLSVYCVKFQWGLVYIAITNTEMDKKFQQRAAAESIKFWKSCVDYGLSFIV